MPAPEISVIIPTRDRRDDLLRCLAAVRLSARRARGRVEVIVVDDGSRDGTAAAVRRLARRWGARTPLRLVRQERSRGPAAARNLGARDVRSGIIAFTDSDCLPAPRWLAAIVSALRARPGAAAAEGRVLPASPGPWGVYDHVVDNRRGGRWLTCNLAVRAGAFRRAGGFDERFPGPVREDTDFAFTMAEKGAACVFVPGALVRHPVKRGGPGKFLREAVQGLYEFMLFMKHPLGYLMRLRWFDGWAIPAYYLPHYAASAWLTVMALDPVRRSAGEWAGATGLLAAGTLIVMLLRIRRRRVAPGELPLLAAESLLVPLLRLFWVVLGVPWTLVRILLVRPAPLRAPGPIF